MFSEHGNEFVSCSYVRLLVSQFQCLCEKHLWY